MHGTGFVAEVWDEVASELASRYTVYALDRRGHGDSHKPAADRYHFQDFAEDLCRVIEALDLSDIYGIGHSRRHRPVARGKILPERFQRLFVMEPTMMDPRAIRTGVAGLSDFATGAVRGVLRRQAEFDNTESRVCALSNRGRLRRLDRSLAVRPTSVMASHPLGDGRVQLRCTPEIESALLQPIFEAMEQIYTGDIRGNPFPRLAEIKCPVRIATTEKSWPI